LDTTVNNPSSSFELLRSPWSGAFQKLLERADTSLILASPFIKRSRAASVLSLLHRRGVESDIDLLLITDLRPESALNGSSDLEALLDFSSHVPRLRLTYLPSLHAKVYVADQKMVIITSGNLTDPGVESNVEYGIVSTDTSLVSQVRKDFEGYAQLGAKISPEEIIGLVNEIKELKLLFRKAEQTIRVRARRLFQEKLHAARTRLLRHRAKGKSTHAILSQTILFLLSKSPLRTLDLHPLIQLLHPDICDDSIDCVIDGVHFGKKWKHHVRTAQQSLKRAGQIQYDKGRWHLVT
jgi:phosphatidylserine/phosphatidylglycerophosphate/cardiolipin synthase-like enzyme